MHYRRRMSNYILVPSSSHDYITFAKYFARKKSSNQQIAEEN